MSIENGSKPDAAKGSAPQSNNDSTSNAMWGGRFATGQDAVMSQINASIDVDKRFWREDLDGSRAHARMLGAAGLLTREDVAAILEGLDAVGEEIDQGKFPFSAALEDIHMNVEARLRDKIGEAAGRLHTARSRNDQVATDFRLWIRGALAEIEEGVSSLMMVLVDLAERHAETLLPGFTHLQTAQPVTFGHHCLAYVEMFGRDRARLSDARARANECPLGAAALAGTSFPIDRDMTSQELGFARPMANSLDAVSARDFALEALAAAAIAQSHLSRLAEEIVVWSSAQFGFLSLPDSFSTGSSIMPQKKNPDAAELVRAKTGRIGGNFQALLMVIKGLPLAYSKDLQEDKALTFESLDALALSIAAMTGMMAEIGVNTENMRKAASAGYSTATDLADWLVRVAGLPFRDAHHATGRIVAIAEAKGCALDALSLQEMRSVEPAITQDVFSVLSVEASVRSRTSYGGTAPDNVRNAAKLWRQRLSTTPQTSKD